MTSAATVPFRSRVAADFLFALLALLLAGLGCGGSDGTDQPKGTSVPATPTMTPTADLDLTIFVDGAPVVDIFPRVQHKGGPPVSYVVGCTGSGNVTPFELVLADDAGRILSRMDDLDYPCGPAVLCPIATPQFAAGQDLSRRIPFDGTVWVLDEPVAPRNGCDEFVAPQTPYPRCTQRQLPPGRYTLIARFSYCVDAANQVDGAVEARTSFDWP